MISLFDNKLKDYAKKLMKEREEKRRERIFYSYLDNITELNDMQKEILDIEDKRYEYETTGRRIGLTTAGLLKALKEAALNHKRVCIISPFSETARTNRLMFTRMINPEVFQREFNFSRYNSLIMQNGAVIDFRSAADIVRTDGGQIRGVHYDLIIVDETSYIENKDVEYLLELIEPCLCWRDDGQLILFTRTGQL